MYEELIEQLRYMADTPSYTAFHDKTERTIICDKCKSPVCYEREIDAHWCMYQFLMNAANAIERIASEITTIQAENAEKNKEIELLRKAMIKADFTYYFSPDYVDEDTEE